MQEELPREILSVICMESTISIRACNKFFYDLAKKLYCKKFSSIRKIAVTFSMIKLLRSCNKEYYHLLDDLYFTYCFFDKMKVKHNIMPIEKLHNVCSINNIYWRTNLQYLHFYDGINDKVKKEHIPNSATHLIFRDNFNQEITDLIPITVTHLIFGDSFNQEIKNAIPPNVTHLTFGRDFNQQIKGAIPHSVTHLTFGKHFNQEIKEAISSNVTHLTFGQDFNQEIKDAIPNSVTHLTFGQDFNQQINEAIPNSVTHLTFGRNFNHAIDTVFFSVPHIRFNN